MEPALPAWEPAWTSEQPWVRNRLVSMRELVRSAAILRLVVVQLPKRLNRFLLIPLERH